MDMILKKLKNLSYIHSISEKFMQKVLIYLIFFKYGIGELK